jgi:hypothetical protein
MGVFSFLSKYFISIPAMVVLPVPPLPASATEYGMFFNPIAFNFDPVSIRMNSPE